VIPSLKKSWPASPDRFLNGSTATRLATGKTGRSSEAGDIDRFGRGAALQQFAVCDRMHRPGDEPCYGQSRDAGCRSVRQPASSPTRRRPRRAHGVGAHRLGDILHAMELLIDPIVANR